MKKVSVTSLLVAVAIVMMGVILYTVVASFMGYNPFRYITLGDYKGVTLTWEEEEITNEEVAYAMAVELSDYATTTEITQDADAGDTLTVDYVGVMDGKEEDVFTDTGREMVLGNDDFIVSGMDEHLLGAHVGQTLSVTLTVPETHHVPEYIGKVVSFQVTVQKIVRTNLPELTDDFVKTLGDYTSVADYKEKFTQSYKEQRALEDKANLRNTLFHQVVANTVVKGYPQKELNLLVEEFKAGVQKGADDFGMEFYDYASLAYGKNTKEEFDQYVLEYNQGILKQEMVLKAIAKKEGLRVTAEEYETRLAEYVALEEDWTADELVDYFGGEEGMKEQFLLEMVTDVIEEHAVIKR